MSVHALVASVALAFAGTGGLMAQTSTQQKDSVREIFTLSGQIVDDVGGNLVLRHDGGRVEVNFRSWPERAPDGPRIMSIGDGVTVTGWLDKDFIDTGSLDILGVYVEDRRAFFALGGSEPGDGDALRPLVVPTDTLGREGNASMTGIIIEMQADGFVLQAGPAEVVVDTSRLFYNPYDDVGIQVLKTGDRVHVSGTLGTGFPEQPVIHADGVTDIFVIAPAAL
ncbi:hypothetical protein P1J78_24950 [Psychromarinibacter sp. C21-152]|uniref:DUF5666 domain-containing protein n=1 Tax=Psychromarinibacter sediminicola TaxID=3033385 RepID=A0AAE3NZU4_9RHOB|nr:hypothetical protein [Psychromarinibacter sediminicola]MDF0603960.1 hypothetical protein [Psychromarinibacter sediminicola]